MDDDFNTALALSVMADVRLALNKAQEAKDSSQQAYLAGLLNSFGDVLGLFQQNAEQFLAGDITDDNEAAKVEALIEKRNQARADKDWAVADQVRDELTAMGIVLEDAAGKTTWRKA
jgi:cysteinyl-tRNA synthetase